MTNTEKTPAPTAYDHAIALIACTSMNAAITYAQQLRGGMLAEVIALFGRTTYGPVSQRREQLGDIAIGAAYCSAAIRFMHDPIEGAASIDRYRQARTDEVTQAWAART